MRIIKKISVFLLGVAIGLFSIVTITNFLPVGSLNGNLIYHYEITQRLNSMSGNVIKNVAKDKAFFKAMDELKITVTDNEIQKELQGYSDRYGGEAELKNILLDTQGDIESLKISIKKGALSEKAIKYFASMEVGDENAKKELGSKRFNEWLSKLEQEIYIKIF